MDDRTGQNGAIGLRLIGGLDVRLGSRTLAFPTRHCSLLLAVLALSPGRTMARERLASLLWSERGDDQAMASLRQTLYRLRKVFQDIEPPILTVDRRVVSAPGIRSDVDDLRRAMAADPATVAGLYGGPLLAGCGRVDPALDDWLRTEQAVLSEQVSNALRSYAAQCTEAGRHAEAAETAAALLRIDPLDEPAARLRMAALMETGQFPAALALHDDLATRLQEELGVDPEPATLALREELLARRETTEAPRLDVPATGKPQASAAPAQRLQRSAVSIVAFAPQGTGGDPEAFAEAIGALRDQIGGSLDGAGCRVLGPAGQVLTVMFGGTERHAVDAALLAWQLRATDIDAGIGVATGLAIVSECEGSFTAAPEGAGPVIAAASALAVSAGPSGVLLSPEVAEAARGYFLVEPADAGARIVGTTGALNRWEAWRGRPSAPFVGRAAEIGALEAMLDHARAGDGRVAAVVGDAGIGKSRLVHEFLNGPSARRCNSLGITCAERMKGQPFGPIPRLLSDWRERFGTDRLDADCRQALQALLGETVPPGWQELDAPDRRRRIVDLARAVIADACQSDPLIFVVEDLHWADSETEALLDAVVHDLNGAPILLVATYRPEHRGRWVGRSVFELLRLRPLPPDAVERLIAGLGGDPEALRARVTDSAGGIPLFVEELVRTELARPDGTGTPATIADVLSARIAQMEAPARRLLQEAAILGMEAPRDLLARFHGEATEEFSSALDVLLASELLVGSGPAGGRVIRFRHALIHEVAFDTLLRRDRRHLHRQALDLLTETGAEPATLAFHAEACEDWTAAAAWFCKAGDGYAEITACREARDAYRQALEAERKRGADNNRTEVELHLRLRPVLVPLGDYGQARNHLDRAEELLSTLDHPPLEAAVHISKSYLFSTHGELDRAVASAEQAAGAPAIESFRAAEARLALGQALSLRGDIEGTRQALLPALPFYDAHPKERFGQTGTRSVWCHGHLAHVGCLAGDLETAEEHAVRAASLAEGTGRPLDRIFSMHRHGEVLMEREDFEGSAALMEDAMRIAMRVDAPLFTVWFGCDLAPAYVALGRLEDARRLLALQEPEARRLSLQQFSACLALGRGELLLAEGEVAEAGRHADAVLKIARKAGYLALETAAMRLAGAVERLCRGETGTLQAAADLSDKHGFAGAARRARALMELP